MVPKLQSLMLQIVPTVDIVENNLTHLLHPTTSCLAIEMDQSGLIPQWFLCQLLDAGNTLYFCFYQFIHKKAHRLPMNEHIHFGHQESHCKEKCSMEMFAMRVSRTEVVVYIYSNPYVEKHGFPSRNGIIPPDLSGLTLDCVFTIDCTYDPKRRRRPTYEELFSTDNVY